MIAVIFKTDTTELLQTCMMKSGQLPETYANIVFAANNLEPLDYTVRQMTADYTSNQFRKHCYILDNEVYEKGFFEYSIDKSTISADGEDEATISGVPEGALVYIDKVYAGDVGSDGLVVITSTIPKQVKVSIEAETYQKVTVTINAT